MHYQERGCARQQLDETDTERCMGRDELGRPVWHAVDKCGSCVEVVKAQLTKKERDLHCQGFWRKEYQSLSQGDFTCCRLTSRLTLEAAQALAWHGHATRPHNDECRERIRTIIERTLTGKVRMNAYEDRVVEDRASEKRGKELELREVQEMCLWNPGTEQVAGRHANASGGDITENQHEENRMRDIHIGKRGSEAAREEQRDKLMETVRFEQEAPSVSASADPPVALEYPASGERDKIGWGPYLCRSPVMLMTTYKFQRWMRSPRWIDDRVVTSKKCWIGIEKKMPEIAGDVK